MPGPMSGVRVVEIGVWVAGPAAGGVLADWGADVVKIEPPGIGDPARTFARMLGADLPCEPDLRERQPQQAQHRARSRDKPAARAIALELIERADVFVTNVRTAGLARLGLDLDIAARAQSAPRLRRDQRLRLRRPRRRQAPPTTSRASGRARASRRRSRRRGSTRRSSAAAWATTTRASRSRAAIAAALFHRERTGEGQLVMTSLLREGLYTLSFDLSVAMRFGVGMAVGNRATMGNPCINNYRDRDGKLVLAGRARGRAPLAAARARGRPSRVDRRPALRHAAQARAQNAQRADRLARRDLRHAARATSGARSSTPSTTCGGRRCRSVDEVLADPQVHAAGGFVEVPDGDTTTLLPATPVDFDGTPWAPRAMAPAHGQHTDEILAELGRSPAQIAELRAGGVAGSSSILATPDRVAAEPLRMTPTERSADRASLAFLTGGGEMGERIRGFDWSQTPLGGFERWPQSLAQRGEFSAPVARADRAVLGPRFHHDLQRRLSPRVRREAPECPRTCPLASRGARSGKRS